MLILQMLLGSRGLASQGLTVLSVLTLPTELSLKLSTLAFSPLVSPLPPPPAHPPCRTVLFQFSFQKQLQLSAISLFLTQQSLARLSLHSSLNSWFHKLLTSPHPP